MEFDNKKDYAVYLKHNGHNCAQAVLLAYKEKVKIDDMLLDKIGSGFGTGMGGMQATCGALVGANIVLGLLNNKNIPTKLISKEMLNEFKTRSKATLCKDLKGLETHEMLCSCDDCIRNAIDVLDQKIVEYEL